jgi:hypothetical protein
MASSSKQESWEQDKDKLLQDFSELLESISSVDLKEKFLWKQIYDNAISDRKSADLLYMNLYPELRDLNTHATHGQHVVKYLERMEKSNEQLLKLAALIRKAVEDSKQEEGVNVSDVFGRGKK